MAYPKGRLRGRMSDDHRQKLSRANSEGQRKRWADPEKRARALAGCKKSWSGARAKDRVVWTPEMDAELRHVMERGTWPNVREVAAERCGVSDRLIIARIKTLGLCTNGMVYVKAARAAAWERDVERATALRRKGWVWSLICHHLKRAELPLLREVVARYPDLRRKRGTVIA